MCVSQTYFTVELFEEYLLFSQNINVLRDTTHSLFKSFSTQCKLSIIMSHRSLKREKQYKRETIITFQKHFCNDFNLNEECIPFL